MSLVVTIIFIYFAYKIAVCAFRFIKYDDLLNDIQIVSKLACNEPLINAAPDFKMKYMFKKTNHYLLDKNFKKLLIIEKPKNKNHISISVNYK
jgi:hypothetical protein